MRYYPIYQKHLDILSLQAHDDEDIVNDVDKVSDTDKEAYENYRDTIKTRILLSNTLTILLLAYALVLFGKLTWHNIKNKTTIKATAIRTFVRYRNSYTITLVIVYFLYPYKPDFPLMFDYHFNITTWCPYIAIFFFLLSGGFAPKVILREIYRQYLQEERRTG